MQHKINKKLSKLQSLNTPQSYYEAIDTLGENDIIPKEFIYNFAKIALFSL